MEKLLIGGQALVNLGSSRSTNDIDYLVNNTDTKDMFIHTEDGDFINANGHNFFSEIWNAEKGNTTGIASAQSLLELKAFAFVQHFINRNWQKVDDAEFDIKWLVRTFNLKSVNIVGKYVTNGQLAEIYNVISEGQR